MGIRPCPENTTSHPVITLQHHDLSRYSPSGSQAWSYMCTGTFLLFRRWLFICGITATRISHLCPPVGMLALILARDLLFWAEKWSWPLCLTLSLARSGKAYPLKRVTGRQKITLGSTEYPRLGRHLSCKRGCYTPIILNWLIALYIHVCFIPSVVGLQNCYFKMAVISAQTLLQSPSLIAAALGAVVCCPSRW